ncbi:MAG: mevalonate kinase [Bacteroidetes bacterium]|nr:mevalonate kinase [Bacteroidota bacterium]
MKDSLYYSKILLFGEYGIIEDSMGLSIPYTFYKGKLLRPQASPTRAEQQSNRSLSDYCSHLEDLQAEGNLPCRLDLVRLRKDIHMGLCFESSIPQGFGVGSSGALVAAVYDSYALDKITEADIHKSEEALLKLKTVLAGLESYFHGRSSGLDPLICYLNLPILIKGKTDLGTVAIPTENLEGKGGIFLMDSGTPGKTHSMVSLFLTKLKDEGFRHLVKTRLKKYNDACIQAFLKGDTKPLMSNLKELSSLFLENFRPMIPDHFEALWRKGIETNAYYLKLCGSGGGGFVLGFTEDLEKAQSLLQDQHLRVIHKF